MNDLRKTEVGVFVDVAPAFSWKRILIIIYFLTDSCNKQLFAAWTLVGNDCRFLNVWTNHFIFDFLVRRVIEQPNRRSGFDHYNSLRNSEKILLTIVKCQFKNTS